MSMTSKEVEQDQVQTPVKLSKLLMLGLGPRTTPTSHHCTRTRLVEEYNNSKL